ncbi:MAG: hypothetical protein PWQ10_36 [Patescibacteria group bacterium]|nr:hypothetical protein [Patescibacteria group bacterium]
MIDSIDKNELSKLQSKILNFVSKNNNFCDITHKSYEDNFIPHLTIRRDLSKAKFDNAISELPYRIQIKTAVDKVILAVVPNKDTTEQKPKESDNLSFIK